MQVVEHPSYYSLRSEIIYLNQQKRIKKLRARKPQSLPVMVWKSQPEIGFVLTVCALSPLKKGFFVKHGPDEVTLVRETSWRGITDGGRGYLDAAQMPSGMPL